MLTDQHQTTFNHLRLIPDIHIPANMCTFTPPSPTISEASISSDLSQESWESISSLVQSSTPEKTSDLIDSELTKIIDSIVSSLSRGRVQIGKNLNRDNLHHQFALEVLKLRLSRWWSAIIRLSQHQHPAIDAAYIAKIKANLGPIKSHLEELEMTALETWITEEHWLVELLQEISLKYYQPLCGSEKGLIWVIDEQDDFPILANMILAALNALHRTELNKTIDLLRSQDGSTITNQPQEKHIDIYSLRKKTYEVDPRFSQFLATGNHLYPNLTVKGNAQIHSGDVHTSDYQGPLNGARHTYYGTKVSGNAKVFQGNLYGFTTFPR